MFVFRILWKFFRAHTIEFARLSVKERNLNLRNSFRKMSEAFIIHGFSLFKKI